MKQFSYVELGVFAKGIAKPNSTIFLCILIFLIGCKKNNSQYQIKAYPIENVKTIVIGWYNESFWFVKRNESFGYNYIVLYKNKEVIISEKEFYIIYQCIVNINNYLDTSIFQKMNQMCKEDIKYWSHLPTSSVSIFLYTGSQNKRYEWNCFNMGFLPYPQKNHFQEFFEVLRTIEKEVKSNK